MYTYVCVRMYLYILDYSKLVAKVDYTHPQIRKFTHSEIRHDSVITYNTYYYNILTLICYNINITTNM